MVEALRVWRIWAVCAAVMGNANCAEAEQTQEQAEPVESSKFKPFGDFRLRYEGNAATSTADASDRMTLRTRLGIRYEPAGWLTLGARAIVSNSSTANGFSHSLADFRDTASFRVDQAFVALKHDDTGVVVGRFPNPFLRTNLQLIWDDDVSPQGASLSQHLRFTNGWAGGVTALYFPLESETAQHGSDMLGAQLSLNRVGAASGLQFAVAYYDYSITGVSDEARELNGNLLDASGQHYQSDFNLLDVVAGVNVAPGNQRWPIAAMANYVKNHGAVTDADSGFSAEILVGRAHDRGDFRFGYAYSTAETDAVFAVLSHDNTRLASDYRQHTVGFEFVLAPWATLSSTWYHYRIRGNQDLGSVPAHEWLDRVRFNFMASF